MSEPTEDRPEMDAIKEIESIHRAAAASRQRAAPPALADDRAAPDPPVAQPAQAPAAAAAPAPNGNGNGNANGNAVEAAGYRPAVPVAGAERVYLPPEPLRAPNPLGELPPMSEMLGIGAPRIPGGQAPVAPPPVRDIRSLEDAYAVYPDIGQGLSFIRVERVEPKQWQGHNTAGYIGDFHEQISTMAFAERFGGDRYRISVMGPPRSRYNTPEQGGPIRTLLTFEMRVPGPPNLEDSMNRYQQQGAPPVYAYPPGENVQVQIERMKMEREREKEVRELAMASGRPYEELFRDVRASGDLHTRTVLEQAERRIEEARNAHRDANLYIQKLDAQKNELVEKNVLLQKDLAEARMRTETDQIREIKERYDLQTRERQDAFERERRALIEGYEGREKELRTRQYEDAQRRTEETGKERERIESMYRMQLDSELRKHTEERTKLSDDLRHERDVARDQARVQIEMHEKESARTIQSLKDSYEGRIQSLQDQLHRETTAIETRYRDQLDQERQTHKRELESEKGAAARELRSVSENRQMLLETTKATQAAELSSIRSELEREREAREGLESENRELQQKLHKEVPEYLAEATNVATMLGWEKKSEKSEEEFSLGKVIAQSTKSLIEKGPDMVREISAMRQNPGAVIQQQQLAQAQHQVREQAHALAIERQRLGQLAMGQGPQGQPQQGHRPGQHAQPPNWARAETQQQPGRPSPPPVTGQVGPRPKQAPAPVTGYRTVPTSSPVQPRTADGTSTARPVAPEDQVMAPPAGDIYHPPPPAPSAPVQQQAAPAQHAPETVSQGAQAQQNQQNQGGVITQEQMTEFYEKLGDAITTKYPTREFAERFVAEVGLEKTRELVAHVTPDQLVATLQDIADHHPQLMETNLAAILTVGGSRYLKDVFKHAKALTEGAPPVGP